MDRLQHAEEEDVDDQTVSGEIAALRRELETVRRQADAERDLLRQLRADFAEFRRRVEAQRAEQASQARVDLLLQVLPVLDGFQQILAASPVERRRPGWGDEVETIERQLRDVLESEGVQRIEAVGALYNPWLHEALQHQTSPELDDQRILAVVREGYRIGDRVIRPAQVVVARRGS